MLVCFVCFVFCVLCVFTLPSFLFLSLPPPTRSASPASTDCAPATVLCTLLERRLASNGLQRVYVPVMEGVPVTKPGYHWATVSLSTPQVQVASARLVAYARMRGFS